LGSDPQHPSKRQDPSAGGSFLRSRATEEKALQERVERIKRVEVVSQVVGGLLHDFNNILTVVRGTADSLEATLPPFATELREDVETLRAHAIRGSTLVRQLLSLGRKQESKPEALHLQAVLKESYPFLRRLIPDHTEIEVSVQAGLPMILADRGALEHMILNLCANAKDAMPTGGTLSLKLSEAHHHGVGPAVTREQGPKRGFVRLDVQDTGTGMDHRTLGRLFEPFFTTKGDGGSGLGMTMVLDLVQDQGGFLEADSEVGEGTTVSVFFPIVSSPETSEKATRPGQAHPRGAENILVVEDEPHLRRTVGQTLELLGYKVNSAENGLEALELYRGQKEDVDLILSDIVMPQMGGLELRKELDEEGDPIPILLSSGLSITELQLLEGWDSSRPFLKKPWDLEILARSVRALLDEAAEPRSNGGESPPSPSVLSSQ